MAPKRSELQRLAPQERAGWLRDELARARRRMADALGAGRDAVRVCRGFADSLDDLVLTLYDLAGGDEAVKAPMALMATGGWGRKDTCPFSDIDVLFLTRGEPDGDARELAERMLYPLWDAKLDVGHAVRSLDSTLGLIGDDVATATALLDARRVCGDSELAGELLEGTLQRLAKRGNPTEFVNRLVQEKERRHARFGDSLYLLEPNLKHGAGGLRDLMTGLWAARARWRTRGFAKLLPLGAASARQVAVLRGARSFLLHVRCAVHMAAGRRQDQMSFELQEAIAPVLFPLAQHPRGEVRPAVAPAVEELMRRYYLHAKAVVRETDRLLERAIILPRVRPRIRRLDASFTLFNGQISSNDPAIFSDSPSEMMRLFRLATELDVPVYGHTKDVIAERMALDATCLTEDPRAHELFRAAIGDKNDGAQPSRLEQMHDLGLVSSIIPEFVACTGRVQHDLYHRYTVDQHQLYTVALLKRVARGELSDEAPELTEAMAAIKNTDVLYLAALLHDTGKPFGKGHSEKGAQLARHILPRIGYSDEDAEQTAFLVQHHLLMAHISQRRDLQDTAMIARFAETVGNLESLRQLYLLTYCDTAMTNPENMSEWKATLLAELYSSTYRFLSRGHEDGGARVTRRIERRRRGVQARLESDGYASVRVSDWMAGLPDRYFATVGSTAIHSHAVLSLAGQGPVRLAVRTHREKGYSEVTVLAPDSAGLLARIAGVMLANRINIVGARIFSRTPIGKSGEREALDVFFVSDRNARAASVDDQRWQRVETDLTSVLSGAVRIEDLVAERSSQSTLKPRVTPFVLTEVAIDNKITPDFTVLDVTTRDRIGVLYAITHALTELGLDIALAKVATEAERVADAFYIRDRETGAKLHDAGRVAEVVAGIRRALDAICV